jgi:opacity protein-like surface antigen
VPVASDRDGGFAYQAIGDLDFALRDKLRLFGEYRYLGTTAVKTELSLPPGFLDVDNKFHLIILGLRIHF